MQNPFSKTLTEHAKSPLSLGAVAVVCIALTQIGAFLKGASHVVAAVDVAYAAQEKATKVDEQFQKYLAAQDANAKAQQAAADAINRYIRQQAQQMPNQRPPQVWTEEDMQGNTYCTNGTQWWWPTEEGRCE